MLTTSAKQAAFALDRKQSVRVLEQALRSKAIVTFTPNNDESTQFHGPIDRHTPESIWIEVLQDGAQPELPMLSVCCQGVLELGDARYLFDTNVMAIGETDDGSVVEVALPE